MDCSIPKGRWGTSKLFRSVAGERSETGTIHPARSERPLQLLFEEIVKKSI
jgi:hypothetical protein